MRLFVPIVLVLSCGSAAAQFAVGKPYKIPTDAQATYRNLEFGGKGHMRTIVTQRDGKSGTSYNKREVDCRDGRFRYVGTGDTMEQMKASKPLSKMSDLVDGSISSYVAAQACSTYQDEVRQKRIDTELKKAGVKR